MESTSTTFSIIIAFWISGVFMAWYSLWLPAIRIIGVLEPENIAYKYRLLGAIIFLVFSFIALPFMIHIILNDNHKERFLRAFIPAYLGRERDE
jgi:hypothetical protein